MKTEEFIVGFLFFAIVILIFTVPIYAINNVICSTKAKALGYKCSFGLIQGCVLEKPDGRKFLLEQMRDFGN